MQELHKQIEHTGYITDEALLVSIYLACHMHRPLFLEGEPGVGKTEVAKVLAEVTGGPLIRVQCYPGLESHEVLYEWNYLKQILNIRQQESGLAQGQTPNHDALFSESFLIARPLLQAILSEQPAVLLIDEVDRADERFEAFLLEFLSDYQVSIPEYGTVKAKTKPYVILTSNRTRDVHDALRRRCLYQWIDYPSYEKEWKVINAKAPDLADQTIRQICSFVKVARLHPFQKKPGMAETLEWAQTIAHFEIKDIFTDPPVDTFGSLFKTKEDMQRAQETLDDLLHEAKAQVRS